MYDFIKRSMDLIIASLFLGILLPIIILIAILIKLTSRGPLFYKQRRTGKNLKPFTMLKFRTMRTDYEDVELREYVRYLIERKLGEERGSFLDKLDKEPRITAVGRFLRKYSLDEIPQLINVLKGDMSMVGPRPLLSFEVTQYNEWQKERFSCKPGMTGLWQVSGRTTLRLEDMIKLDIEYSKNRSIILDIKILSKTVPATLKGTGF